MARFGDLDLQTDASAGAAFELTVAPTFYDYVYAPEDGGEVVIPGRSRLVVVRGLGSACYLDSLQHAQEAANRALDMVLTRGGKAAFLDQVKQPRVVWWQEQNRTTLRVVSVETMAIGGGVAAVMELDESGQYVRKKPPPATGWDESLRYYRASEASTDLFDSFRSLYLGLEALLSAMVPPVRHGERWEGEGRWLKRALRLAHDECDLSQFAPSLAKTTPPDAIYDDLWVELRTATFHAKQGRDVWLPQGWGGRERVLEGRQRYARMYRKLADKHLRFSIGSGSISPQFVAEMNEATTRGLAVYVSDDPTKHIDEVKGQYEIAPAGGRTLTLPSHVSDELSDAWTSAVVGSCSGEAVMSAVDGVHRFGTLRDGRLATVENLANVLDVSGVDRVEVAMIFSHRHSSAPRQDFSS